MYPVSTIQLYQINYYHVIFGIGINCNVNRKIGLVECANHQSVLLKKMAKIRIKLFYLLFFVICIKIKHAMAETNKTDNNFFDFEQMKRDIFLKSDFNNLDAYGFRIGYLKCFKELNDIRNGLMKYDKWAMKRK